MTPTTGVFRVRPCWSAALFLFLSAACAARTPPAAAGLARGAALELAGEFSIPPGKHLPDGVGLLFGGISGLAPVSDGRELLGICDDRNGSRVYRLRVSGQGTALRVEPFDIISLGIGPGAPAGLDPEAIVRTADGGMLIASEGVGSPEPRIPPAIVRYSRTGAYIGQLELRDRYVPTPVGPLMRGVRENAGFEGLTLAPGGGKLFTATETALAQDGGPATFETGTLARLLEYDADGGSFHPRREFVYPLEPVDRPGFEASVVVKGLVDLLALSDTEILALERTYVENQATPGRGANYARIYRISIHGATDVSGLESIAGAAGLAPVRKTLVLDLATVKGLSPALAALDNFEALAFGPRLSDGSSTLLVASDDNFSPNQRTWFVMFRIG